VDHAAGVADARAQLVGGCSIELHDPQVGVDAGVQ
jgi:hypothetical protein